MRGQKGSVDAGWVQGWFGRTSCSQGQSILGNGLYKHFLLFAQAETRQHRKSFSSFLIYVHLLPHLGVSADRPCSTAWFEGEVHPLPSFWAEHILQCGLPTIAHVVPICIRGENAGIK